MKISYRILIINFAIVVLILASSAIAFYSILYSVLSSQQSKYLLNSANEFIYAYRSSIQDVEDDFHALLKSNPDGLFGTSLRSINNIDFIFEVDGSNFKNITRKTYSENIASQVKINTLQDFLDANPFSIIKNFQMPDGKTVYFGKIINSDALDNLSKKVNAGIALVWNGTPAVVSSESLNQKYSFALSLASKSLSAQNNFNIFGGSSEANDILATIYKPTTEFSQGGNFQFLIFTTLNEAADLRTNLKYFLIIIGLAGVVLSLILTILFTDKIRKQIIQLSIATSATKEGNFQNKIEVKTKDELGQLAAAFNTMLDELQKKEKAKSEYSEFITLLNQNPTLTEVSDAALKKIIATCGFTIGALYIIDEDRVKLLSSHGLKNERHQELNSDLFNSVINNKETLTIDSQEALPFISAGVVQLQIKHLLAIPIIYNNKVISIIELGSFNKPSEEAVEYLSKIKEQLAIGLTNASAFVQLENLVAELKQLNEDYQKQNIQIRKQNETLVDLHKKLKEKADELEIQKQKAEEATKLKSQFLASMSHELRTPMNSILGLTQLILEDKTLTAKNRERIEVVLKSGVRLMGLINDILDLSKIEAGKMEIHNEEIIVEELIREVENSIIPLIEQKDLSFRVIRKTNTQAVIRTDRGRVTQVLVNLLGNAVKFTENGFVELHVSSGEDNNLNFEVVDSGIGISDDHQKVIFDEFRQIDGATTRRYSGTGLGLAICKKIAELLNGSITVKSTLGKGSTFHFSVPFNFINLKDYESNAKINVASLIKNRKNPILIIDDDEEIRYTIGQYLTSKGYDVEYANDGVEGYEKAVKLQPFAITLDIMMPRKDGWTVLKDLKENPLTRDIPVILISILGDKNLGYGLGAFEYFVKPISPVQLFDSFKKLESLAKKRIEKIVIVDDDETEFEKFKEAFKNDNIRIEYIRDSELAFSKILEVQPDLVIIDLIMPNMDGVTLSYRLKSNIETKHIPIIMSTAKDLSDEEKNSLNNIVEEITVKSKGHPLDVLKVVRDRIKMLEPDSDKTEDTIYSPPVEDESEVEDEKELHLGTVLIVDDDPDSLYTLSEIVQACDCKTIPAKSGLECLKILEHKLPDLILLDIMMPEMDGFQTFSRIKQSGRTSRIPVFAITAKAMLEDKQVILKYGFDDYIAKPVNSGVLAFKIERLLSKLKIIPPTAGHT